MPHVIRLRGPWKMTHASLPKTATVKLPGSLIGQLADIAPDKLPTLHGVELTRVFHSPTGLDESSIVSLCGGVSDHPGVTLTVAVNQQILVPQAEKRFRCDVTRLLRTNNQISLRFQAVSSPRTSPTNDITIDEVWLEID